MQTTYSWSCKYVVCERAISAARGGCADGDSRSQRMVGGSTLAPYRHLAFAFCT